MRPFGSCSSEDSFAPPIPSSSHPKDSGSEGVSVPKESTLRPAPLVPRRGDFDTLVCVKILTPPYLRRRRSKLVFSNPSRFFPVKTFSLLRVLFAVLFSLAFAQMGWGQTTILSTQAGGGALPAGWTGTNNVTSNAIDRTSYWLVESSSSTTKDFITSNSIDLSGFSSITINVNVATFGGSTTNQRLRVELSTDGGSNYPTSLTSAQPTASSPYIAGGPITFTGPFTATTRLRFSNNATSLGVRIQQLGITGAPATPAITLADNGTQVTDLTVPAGTTNVILHQSSLAVTTANANLTAVSFTTAGTYSSTDVVNFKVWYSADNAFSSGTDTVLGTISSSLGAGAKSLTGLSRSISSGSTGYIFITSDIAASPTGGATLNVNALTTANFTFTAGTKSGSTTAGGAKTLQAAGDPPTVTTGTSSSVTNTSALVSGNNVTADGGLTITERGVVFGTSANPTTANGKATTSGTTGSYDTPLSGLLGGTLHYARAFATNSAGTSYGSDITFTTDPAVAPTVTTGTAGSITGISAIISASNVTSDGGAPITERGIVFASTPSPTTADSKAVVAGTTGTFDGTLTGLSPETPYFARAFATNSAGTTYGDEISFTTTVISAPTVLTGSAGSIGTTTATISTNNVTSDGGSAITERGVVYSTTVFPTTSSTKLTSAGTTGTFNSSLTGLTQGTVYYLRAYAINAAGTSYGVQIGFATNAASVTRTFQEGVSSYTGTDDTFLDSGATTTNNGNATLLAVDGTPVVQALIRFNNIIGSGGTQIPTGSTVTAASLRITVDDQGSGIQVYQMLANWTEASTWSSLTNGITAGAPETGSTVLGSIGANNSSSNVAVGDRTISGLESAVQSWVNGSTNNGFALLPFASGSNGIDFWSSEGTTAAQRPLLSVTYTPPAPAVILPPTVVTGTAGSLTPSGATISANDVTSAGGGTITERGIVFATTQNPTIANSKVAVAGTTGSFDANLTGLLANTLYYARAFATNSAGTDYGAQISFTTPMAGGAIVLSGSVAALSSTYGTASTAASFTVEGTGLTGDLTVTPPAGFETSLTEGSGYGATTTITASGTLASTTVWVRLAADTAPGSYSGNISVSGGGASSETLAIPASTVSAKELTLTGAAVTTKPYDTTTAATITGSLSGIVSPDVVTFTGTGTFASATPGTAIGVTAALVLTGADAAKYTLTQPTGLSGEITKASQTITFAALPAKLVTDADFDLTATASSGLAVNYASSNEAVATVTGNTVTIVGAGTTTITASQAGDANYDPSMNVERVLTVTTGPTVLALGDISVIGFNSNSPDGFAFVTWVDLNPNTVIKFTDNGFLATASATATNNGRGGENFATWTNTTSNVIPAGSVISVVDDANPDTVSQGSVVQSLSGISNSGDQIFAYQGPGLGTLQSNSDFGTNLNPSTFTGTILFGLNFGTDWLITGTPTSNTSYLPTELTAANTSIALTTASTSRGQYTGGRTGQTLAQFKAAVTNTANWTTATGTSGNITLDTTPFTIATPVAASGQFDFSLSDANVLSFPYNGTAIPNVTVSPITKVGVATSANSPNFQGNWPNTGTLNANGAANADLVGSPNEAAYFEFTLTADPGYVLSDPKVRFGIGRELTGPRQFQWRSSVDGFAAPIAATRDIDTTGTDTEIFSNEFRVLDQNFFTPDPINGTDFNEVSLITGNRSSITFRYYAYGAEATNTGARLTRFLNFLLDVTPAATAVPSAPAITSITPNDQELVVAYTAPASDGGSAITGYEYSVDGGQNWTAFAAPAIPASPFILGGLTNLQTYRVQIRALTAVGIGDASPVQNGIPQPNTITGLAATEIRTIDGGSYTLSAVASSNLPVSYSSDNTAVATVSGNVVTIVGVGTATITATQPGDATFGAATPVTQALTVLATTWKLIEDFEALTLGALPGQNGWGGSGSEVIADPSDSAKKVGMLNANAETAYKLLATDISSSRNTLFLRFRGENVGIDPGTHAFAGASDATAPSVFTDYDAQWGIVNSATPLNLRNGGTGPTADPEFQTISADIWYSSWTVIDNVTNTFRLYLQGGAFTTPTLITTLGNGDLGFRNGGPLDLANLKVFLRAGAGLNAANEEYYFDDVYYSAGTNLSDPLNPLVTAPIVATGTAGSITRTNATVSGNVVHHDGASPITERGVVYSTSANPTIADTKVVVAGTTGTFAADLTGLAMNTPYFVRAFATNAIGTAYGSDVSFTTLANNLPAFAGMSVGTLMGSPVNIFVAKVLARSSDPDGDAVVLTGVTAATAQAGTATLVGTTITYTPAASFSGADTITFTLSDGIAPVDHTIAVTVSPDAVFTSPENAPRITDLGGGPMRIAFFGIPGRTYGIQRSETMAPGSWTQIAAVTAAANSTVTFDDPSPPGTAFYRIVFPAAPTP